MASNLPRPLLVATVLEETPTAACAVLRGLGGRADLAEIRLDALARPDLPAFVAASPIPLIATCRPVRLGGRIERTDEARMGLLAAAARAGFAWVDVELESFHAWKPAAGEKLIASFHDFSGTPADLRYPLASLAATRADCMKLVTTARTLAEANAVLDLLGRGDRPLAAFAMGELGFYTRVLGAARGSALVYAAARADNPAAPGQPDLDMLLDRYRVRELDAGWRIYGVVGDPVAHSRGPALMNAYFRQAGIPAVYLPFRVTDAADGFPALRRLGGGRPAVSGLSVTLPHKEALLAYLDSAAEDVTASGAANTVVAQADGAWRGLNTDLTALRNIFARHCGDLAGRPAVVLGAGGAARAAALALVRAGACVCVSSHSPWKAAALAHQLGVDAVPWEARAAAVRQARVLVHATPLGMEPAADISPLPPGCISAEAVVLDAVYTPAETRLLAEARRAGARALSGTLWFAEQAALQLEAWTGGPVDRAVVSGLLRGIMGNGDQVHGEVR